MFYSRQNKIIVKIHAGLGNQMFQYAVGKSLSIQKDCELLLDATDIKKDTSRRYELDRFNIDPTYLNEDLRKWQIRFRSRRYAPLRYLLLAIRSPLALQFMTDLEQGFDERPLKTNGLIYLDGYWQDESYFKNIRGLLLKEFTFKNAPDSENARMLSRIEKENAVCVHVRRGDYVNTALGRLKHGACSVDYYLKAIAYIQEQVINPAFFIFSDDPDWVASHFPQMDSLTVVSHNVGVNDPEDLRLMMNCRHFIIANSSFSWWAAWLGQHDGKIVVAPRQWLASSEENFKSPVPETWITLD